MKRRNFLFSTSALFAANVLALSAKAGKWQPLKKAFKVKALENRYKEKIIYGKTPIDFKLLSTDTDNRLSVFISTNNRKGFGPPLHVHHSFDEFFCVLEGEFIFQLDNEKVSLKAGDSLFIPRNVKHAFDYTGATAGTLLVNILPAKDMEKFFFDMGKLLPEQGMPDMAAMQALYKSYDSEILGPPLQ